MDCDNNNSKNCYAKLNQRKGMLEERERHCDETMKHKIKEELAKNAYAIKLLDKVLKHAKEYSILKIRGAEQRFRTANIKFMGFIDELNPRIGLYKEDTFDEHKLDCLSCNERFTGVNPYLEITTDDIWGRQTHAIPRDPEGILVTVTHETGAGLYEITAETLANSALNP